MAPLLTSCVNASEAGTDHIVSHQDALYAHDIRAGTNHNSPLLEFYRPSRTMLKAMFDACTTDLPRDDCITKLDYDETSFNNMQKCEGICKEFDTLVMARQSNDCPTVQKGKIHGDRYVPIYDVERDKIVNNQIPVTNDTLCETEKFIDEGIERLQGAMGAHFNKTVKHRLILFAKTLQHTKDSFYKMNTHTSTLYAHTEGIRLIGDQFTKNNPSQATNNFAPPPATNNNTPPHWLSAPLNGTPPVDKTYSINIHAPTTPNELQQFYFGR